jgi:hypothetical protein
MHRQKRSPAANKRLAQWRVKWLIKHSTSHQHLWWADSLVLRNPPLRQAPNRCGQVLLHITNGKVVFFFGKQTTITYFILRQTQTELLTVACSHIK